MTGREDRCRGTALRDLRAGQPGAGGPGSSEAPKCAACGGPRVTGGVAELDPVAHDRLTQGDALALPVDGRAPRCGPCRVMAPDFARRAAGIEAFVRAAAGAAA